MPARYKLCWIQPGHKPSFGWLADALYNGDSWLPDTILVNPPNMRAVPFCVHSARDICVSECIKKYRAMSGFLSLLVEAALGRDDFFLDLGANIGWFTVLAAMLVGNGSMVLGVEPGSANFEVLSRNVAIIKDLTGHKVEALNVGISDRDGYGQLFLAPENLGDHRIYPAGQEKRAAERIRLVTLAGALLVYDRLPDMIKMDVQGAEDAILVGAEPLFAAGWRPVWLFEFSPMHLKGAGVQPEAHLRRFTALGYELWRLGLDAHELMKIEVNNPDDFIYGYMRERPGSHLDICAIMPDSPKKAKIADYFA